MTATIVRGDALHLPLADNSVDLIVTSPPYFALRSYQDGGQHYAGQIGSESTPQAWLEALWAATAEMVRVLKPSGSIFVNLGDKYNSAASGQKGTLSHGEHWRNDPQGRRYSAIDGARLKSLMLLPERYRIGCVDRLGLIARAVIIWDKPNGLPESVTDRVRRSHEDWVHLTKQPRYYSAVDEVREAQQFDLKRTGGHREDRWTYTDGNGGQSRFATTQRTLHPLGKLPGSVWSIPSEPLQVPPELGVDHFAAYPTEWPRRIIAGWSPAGICTACGEGRRPVVAKALEHVNRTTHAKTRTAESNGQNARTAHGRAAANVSRESATITGYACACTIPDAPTHPAVVLDPFAGTCTTGLVGDVLGRHVICVDLSADYCRLGKWRVNDPAQRAKAAQVPKPPPVIDGQLTLEGML